MCRLGVSRGRQRPWRPGLRPPALTELVLSGEAAAVDADAVYQHLFTRIPSEHFHSPMLAFEFVQFCRDPLLLLGSNLDLLKTSFPNLFKACELGPWGSARP